MTIELKSDIRLLYGPGSLGLRNMRNWRRSVSTSWPSAFCWRSTNSSVSNTSSMSSSDSRSVSITLFTSSIAVCSAGSDLEGWLGRSAAAGTFGCASTTSAACGTVSTPGPAGEVSRGRARGGGRPPRPRPRPPRRPRPRLTRLGAKALLAGSACPEPMFASLSGTMLIPRCLESPLLQREFCSTHPAISSKFCFV